MTLFEAGLNKDDDESHDVCPTCEAPVRTTTPIEPTDTTYRSTCTQCPWSVDLTEAPTAEQTAKNQLRADGGTNVRSGRELLDQFDSDPHAAKLSDYLAGKPVAIELKDILRPFDLAGGELCLMVDHDNLTEFIWPTDGCIEFVALSLRPDGTACGPIEFSPSDVASRIGNPIDIRLTENVPVEPPSGVDR